ncbi:MAG: hypothetical protein NTX53_20905 [candidate division WOR-3 bacterium]|nr:hypothetical protein [candidate division WOR-3 bacterium]
MAAKEHLVMEIQTLDEEQLRLVEEYVAFLRFRSRRDIPVVFDRSQAAGLYAEFATEDRKMAEAGMSDYSKGLKREDKD